MSTDMESQNQEEQPDRRGFIKGASCAIGAVIGVVPMAAGVRMALDPLSRKGIAADAEFVRLAEVSDLEAGVPRKFAIVEDKRDKWSRYKDVPVGAVYLLLVEKGEDSKSSEPKVIAYNTVCPHLGCFVDYRPEQQDYFCPCHDSNFALDGSLKKGVSPRGMDTLEWEIRKGSVWVKFQRFKANTKEKIVIG